MAPSQIDMATQQGIDLTHLERKIDGLQSVVENVESDLAYDRSKMEEILNEISSLKGEVSSLKSTVKVLQDRMPVLENKLTDAVSRGLKPVRDDIKENTFIIPKKDPVWAMILKKLKGR